MKTFSKGEIAKSEIAKTGVKTAGTDGQGKVGQSRAKSGKVKRKTAGPRGWAVVIENFKNLLQVKKPVFEN